MGILGKIIRAGVAAGAAYAAVKVGEKYKNVVSEINKTNSKLLDVNDKANQIANAIDNIVDIELRDEEEDIQINVQLEV